MRALPSRFKIALLSAGISGLVLAGFGAAMWVLICDLRLAAVDREILTLGSRHPGLFAGRGNYARLAESLEFTFGEDYTNHIILLLQDAAGRTFYSSPHWPAGLHLDMPGLPPAVPAPVSSPEAGATNSTAGLPSASHGGGGWGWGGPGRGLGQGRGGPLPAVVFTKPPAFFTARIADSTWRIGALGNDEVTLVLGLNQREVELELHRLRTAFLLTLPVALFLVGLGGWVVAGRALRPLKNIADTAEQVTARGLGQRIPEAAESPEAGRVIQVLNRMMDRLEVSFQQATRFSADASHELKTPLAIMQGELENALQSAAPGSPGQKLFAGLLEEVQRLKTIIRGLLLLAQADAGQLKLSLETLDLVAELEGMIEDARVLAAEARLRFEVELPSQLPVAADRALLHTALFNLLQNAIKYNEPGGQVLLRLAVAAGRVTLTIANTGPGIPAADQPRIFDRFYRAVRARGGTVDGIGLGLSLAREIVRAHGGELVLEESRPGWTTFVLKLSQPPALPHR